MSDASADAMVQAMLQSWKRSIDEVDRLRAENERLREFERLARDLVAKWRDNWGPVKIVEAVEALCAAVARDPKP
jgi:hypothetical protein